MHENSRRVFNKHAAPLIDQVDDVLEIGPDGIPSSLRLACPRPQRWDTADLMSESLDSTGRSRFGDGGTGRLNLVLQSPYEIPVPPDTYDAVVSANVAEHVPEIWTWMKELARVTRPGGFVVVVAPTSWPYHEAPIDCWRMYPAAMEALHSFAGLETVVNLVESLDHPSTRGRWVPGKAAHYRAGRKQHLASLVRMALSIPQQAAWDLVAVGQKPLHHGGTSSGGSRSRKRSSA